MGRHNKESEKRYRTRRKHLKRLKKSILQRGNQVCNVIARKDNAESITLSGSSSDATSTSFTVSGVEKLCPPNDHSRELKEKGLSSRPAQTIKHRSLPFLADPLIVGLREYNTIKKRLGEILSKNDPPL